MTTEQKREAIKTGLVIVFGVLMLLSAFGPLAQYRDWLLMVAGIVSIIGSAVFGVELKTPAAQIRNVKMVQASQIMRAERVPPEHTAEDDFQHFLSYSGLSGDNPNVIEKMRSAYLAAWEPVSNMYKSQKERQG